MNTGCDALLYTVMLACLNVYSGTGCHVFLVDVLYFGPKSSIVNKVPASQAWLGDGVSNGNERTRPPSQHTVGSEQDVGMCQHDTRSVARGVAIQFLPGVVDFDKMEALLGPVYPSALGWSHWSCSLQKSKSCRKP